jgi:DNA-binding ferritin-like protein
MGCQIDTPIASTAITPEALNQLYDPLAFLSALSTLGKSYHWVLYGELNGR